MLRHSLATLAYRAAKVLRDAPLDFSGFRASRETRTPGQILAHMGDLLEWGLSLANGQEAWQNSRPLRWDSEVERFWRTLAAFDQRLASAVPVAAPAERLFAGPIADALAHTGQIAMLRRLAGSPVRGENYFRAEISTGRVGMEQAAPVVEFD